MKTKLQLTIAAFALAVISQNVTAQTVTYDFNTNIDGVSTPTGGGIAERSFSGRTDTNGVIVTPNLIDGTVLNTSGVLIQRQSNTIKNNTNVNDLTLFPAAADYSITWKEYVRQLPDVNNTSHRRGFLLRGRETSPYAGGLKTGYLTLIQGSADGSINFRVANANTSGTGFASVAISSPAFFVGGGTKGLVANSATWYRVSISGSNPVVITFATSLDGVTFTDRFTHSDTSNLYPDSGLTQTVSGIGFGSYDWQILDDIVFRTGSSLGTKDLSLNEKSISVVKKDNDISINSSEITIKSVLLFDVTGRVIASKNNINALETLFTNLSLGKGLVLVQITGSDDSVVTRKLVY